MSSFSKQRIALRYWMLGAGMHRGVAALEFAASHHTGLRKDGVTPEFAHQVQIACHVRTLVSGLRHPEDALCVALLHDVREDYDVEDMVIRELFGSRVADSVDNMTKVFKNVKRDQGELFAAMAKDPVASVCKAADRIHNQGSMVGVFTPEKMGEYITETREFFIPMLKDARRNFPDQEPAYENLKLTLGSQLDFVTALLASPRA